MARSKEIPPWGRKQAHVERDLGLQSGIEAPHLKEKMGTPETFTPDMPIGTNQVPSMAHATLVGGMPNAPRAAKGRLRTQLGKYGKNTGFPVQ